MKIRGLVIILCLFLIGCQQKSEVVNKQSDFRTINNMSIGVEDDEGYYYSSEGLIRYYDFKSKKSVIVCSKPGCDHAPYSSSIEKDKLCDAAIKDNSGFYLTIYGDHIYAFERGSFDDKGLSTNIIKSNKDRSEMKIVANFKGTSFYEMIQTGDSVFFTAYEPKFEKSDDGSLKQTQLTTSYIYEYNYKDGKLTTINESEPMYILDERIIGKLDNKLIILRQYAEEETTTEDFREKLTKELWELEDGKLKKSDIELDKKEQVIAISEGYLYITKPGTENNTFDLLRSKGNREDESIIAEGISNPNYTGDSFLYTKGGKKYAYKLGEKTESEVKEPARESYVYGIVRDNYVVIAKHDEDYKLAFVGRDDYLNGADKFVFPEDNQ